MRVLRERVWRPTTRALSYVVHVHYWDYCRQYGQYRYRICLNSPDPDNPHKRAC